MFEKNAAHKNSMKMDSPVIYYITNMKNLQYKAYLLSEQVSFGCISSKDKKSWDKAVQPMYSLHDHVKGSKPMDKVC